MIGTKELRRLAQAATPGPWRIDEVGVGFEIAAGDNVVAQAQSIPRDSVQHAARRANAAFIAAANPAAITELLDRLEAADTELAELRSSMKFRTSLIGRTEQERDALRAKVTEMEQQEPVAKVRIHKAGGNAGIAWSVAPLNDFDSLPLMRDGDKLYTLPGAQNVPSVPEVTDAMAIAFHAALTDGGIGQQEVEEIKTGLRAALAAAPEAKPCP